jgi:hypothetical protein
MNNIYAIGAAAQLPSFTAALDDAIRKARTALLNGSLDCAIDSLKDARRVAREGEDPRAHELANLADALMPAVETLKLVEMCLLDLFPDR